MKKAISIITTAALLLTMSVTAFAYGDPTGGQQNTGYYDQNGNWVQNNTQYQQQNTQYGYPQQNWYYGYNNQNNSYNSYSGEVYTSRNNQYGQKYYLSDWTKQLQERYNNPEFYESAQRDVKRGEAFFLALRTIQDTLRERGYASLQAGYEKPPFWDMNTLVPNAQSEASILWAKGIMLGYPDGSMKMSQVITRAEFAAIFNRVNRLFLNMPEKFGDVKFNDTRWHWAEQDVSTAVKCGVLKGVSYDRFEPEMPLTIEQIWAVSDRYVGQNGIMRENVAAAMNLTFSVLFKGPYEEDYNGDDWSNNGQKITSIVMQQSNVRLKYEETKPVSAKIYPSNLKNVRLDWRSSDSSKVSVEDAWYSNGVAYAKIKGRREGSVTITLKALDGSNKSASFKAIAEADSSDGNIDVTRLEAVNKSITIQQGETKEASVRIVPSNAGNKLLNWKSSNSNIAYVEDSWNSGSYGYARIRGVQNGNTTLRVETTDGSYVTITIYVNVTDNNYSVPVQNITIGNKNVDLKINEAYQLSAQVSPFNATNKRLNWEVDNTNTATVNSYGVVTAKNVGSCVVTVSSVENSNIKEYFYITVKADMTPTPAPTPISTPAPTPIPTPVDTTPPIVSVSGPSVVKIGQEFTITVTSNEPTLSITKDDIVGFIGNWNISKIEDVSQTQKRVTIVVSMIGEYYIAIAPGAAVDASGNRSDWSRSEYRVRVEQ